MLLYEANNTEEPCAKNRTQGSVRGRSGNWPSYLDVATRSRIIECTGRRETDFTVPDVFPSVP